MSNRNNLTPMQQKAIMHGTGNALVSASAGSGKTFVVIERIIRLIIEEGVKVDEILAVTFTKLAAQEMKDKLKLALTKKYLSTGEERLKQELEQISISDISTIHSFCSKLIKKYFYLLGVDYSSRVIDESEKKRLEERAVNELFERLYDLQDEDFLSLVPAFSSGRTDKGLKLTVKELYDYCESEGSIDKVESKTLNTYHGVFELINSEFGAEIKSVATTYKLEFDRLEALFIDDALRKEYSKKLKDICDGLIKASDYFAYFEKLDGVSYSLPLGKSKQAKEQAELKNTVEGFRGWIKDLSIVFKAPRDEQEFKVKSSERTVKKLFKLTKLYGEEYEKVKSEENAVDFNDLEKLTLKLLLNKEVREEVQKTYKYIFVDEYQDVNAVQEEIISLISNQNAFFVGDSKQSIYAFRGCNPTYFKDKYDRFMSGEGTAISLDNNFRSAKSVIDAVNGIFSPIMREEFGGTDYHKNPMIYGGGYGEFEGSAYIHHILKEEKVDKELQKRGVYSVKSSTENKKSEELSAEAKLVIKLVGDAIGKPFFDVKEKDTSKQNKKVGFGDICILLRSVGAGSKLADEIVSGLTKLGIPVSSSVKTSIADYPEIKVLLNVISLLCCADRDVPLASCMLNLFNFSENELANIRILGGKSSKFSFYECVKTVANSQTALGEKTASFVKWLNDKRLIAEFLSVDEVLSTIVKETGYLAKIMASPYGSQRAKRIDRFLSESVQNGKKLKVSEFESHLEDVLEELTVSESSGEDTVKVMTMHASKGLEFPVVIVAGTSKSFNSADRRGNVISSRDYGIAVKSYNDDNMTVSENAVRALIKHRQKAQSTVEELRLFYVALTRAKCYLHVVVNGKDLEEGKSVFEINRMSDFLYSSSAPVITYQPTEIYLDGVLEGTTVAGIPSGEDFASEIAKNLSYKYPFESEISIPVKSSVSDVNKSLDEYYKRTDFFGSSSSETGTAYHRFFELIDFYNYSGQKDLDRFVELNLMSESQKQLIDVDKVDRVLRLEIFKDIKDCTLYKERKFCQLVPAKMLLNKDVEGEVLIQGILDLVAIKGDEAVLIDYKISTIERDSDLKNAYKTQLELYAHALEKILGVKVKKKFIINVLKENVISV